MSEAPAEFEITVNESEKRIETIINDHLARIDYVMLGPQQIIYTHTVVPFSLKGQGVGSALAKFALDYARENDLKVIPQCPFVNSYIKRHPEYADLVPQSSR